MSDRNTGFCLIDMHGNVMFHTVRSRRRDVRPAAEEWSGEPYHKLKKYGYRIVKIQIGEQAAP